MFPKEPQVRTQLSNLTFAVKLDIKRPLTCHLLSTQSERCQINPMWEYGRLSGVLPAGERFWVLPPAHFTHEALFSKSQEVMSVESGLWRRLSCLLPVRNVSLTHSLHLILKASSKVDYLCVNATFTACCSLNAELLPLTETVFNP